MTKKMRELLQKIQEKTAAAKSFLEPEGEGYDVEKAASLLDERDALQKEYDTLSRMEDAEKGVVNTEAGVGGKVDGFKAMCKHMFHRAMDAAEKALISGPSAESGENLLVPDDVRAEINEMRKSYVSAKGLVSHMTTTSLAGSINYEKGTPAGLTNFTDGSAIAEETNPSFVPKKFTITWFGKLIYISNILKGAEKAGLMGYLNRWFVRNAVLTENKKIFDTLKAGYKSGTPKVVKGWQQLKKSITVDLDPSCLVDGVIVTNQSGFACLDEEVDANGRPILQPNPADSTKKMFQGLPVVVFPDAQLANLSGSEFPVIYGSLKAGATFVEYDGLEFASSNQYAFGKNQTALRVLEGFDVLSTDTSAYIYSKFSASAAAAKV